MRRFAAFAACCALAFAAAVGPAPAAGAPSLLGEVLARVPDLPGVSVSVPIEIYRRYLEEIAAPPRLTGPAPFLPGPVRHRLRVSGTAVSLESTVTAFVFDAAAAVRAFPAETAWSAVSRNGAPVRLAVADGWLTDRPGRGTAAFAASARPAAVPDGGGFRCSFRSAPGAPAIVSFDSDEALDAAVAGDPVRIVGTPGAGTHGVRGAGCEDGLVSVSWRPVLTAGRRAPLLAVRTDAAWDVGDDADHVEALMEISVSRGPTDRVELLLPPAADRLSVRGPDVRSVRREGTSTIVFLRGAVAGRTVLRVSFDTPGGRAGARTFPRPGVSGAAERGGIVAVSKSAAGILLENPSPGSEPLALVDLPADVAALARGPVLIARRAPSGPPRADVDLVAAGEFPVRRTLVETMRATVVRTADGSSMIRTVCEVLNDARQFVRIRPPRGAVPVQVLVAGRPAAIAAEPDGTLLVPLVRSRKTVAGLVGFPLVFVCILREPPLPERGTLRIGLPRIDLPIAHASAAVYLPAEVLPAGWEGSMDPVARFSADAAQESFGFSLAWRTGGPQENAFLADHYFRTGLAAYERGNLVEADEYLRAAADRAPETSGGRGAARLLTNIDAALDRVRVSGRAEKALQEAARQEVRTANEELSRAQGELLERGMKLAAEGQTGRAARDLSAAEALGRELARRGASREAEQKAISGKIARVLAPYREEAAAVDKLERERDELARRSPAPLSAPRPAATTPGKPKQAEIGERQALRYGLAGAAATAAAPEEPAARRRLLEEEVNRLKKDAETSSAGRIAGDADALLRAWRDETDRAAGLAARGDIDQATAIVEALRENAGRAARAAESATYDGRIAALGRDLAALADAAGRAVEEGRRKASALTLDVSSVVGADRAAARRLSDFLAANYAADRPAGTPAVAPGDGGTLSVRDPKSPLADAARKFVENAGLKVGVRSVLLPVSPEAADRAGVSWTNAGGVRYAVIDRAQERALADIARRTAGRADTAVLREAVVGTAVRTADGGSLSVEFAGEAANTVSVSGAAIRLPHGRRLLVAGPAGLCLTGTTEPLFWTERAAPDEPVLDERPVEVPLAGRLHRFEKTLVGEDEELTVICRHTRGG